ncbi:MAG: T9SS type A sorting domain-containing protein, partial [Candidatus Zixiibacteriota bacterium]
TTCGPDTVCVPLSVSPSDADVRVEPDGVYKPQTGEVCFYVQQQGSHSRTVIAESLCGADTCRLTVDITILEPPVLSCPVVIDTVLCLALPETLCFPIDTGGTISEIQVSPPGVYSGGRVCFEVSQEGSYEFEIIASGPCGSAVCSTTVNVVDDTPPDIHYPVGLVIERFPDDTSLVLVDGIFAEDAETVPTLTKTCGVGTFTPVSPDSGVLSFLPDTFGTYGFCFEASDGCRMTAETLLVDIELSTGPCFVLSIDGGNCVPVGVRQRVNIMIESYTSIGGFDLLVNYDASVMAFQAATIEGTDIDGWEYFQYRLGSADCGSSCPSGLVRFVGLADMNDGPGNHPPESTLTPNGILIKADFLVANDQNLGGYFLPIGFSWFSCGDNGISDPTGDQFYIDRRIYTPEMNLIWDEDDDVQFPEADRRLGIGAPDECVEGGGEGKPSPSRCIDFINGGICVISPESIDVRGDINLNGIAYEIADAVVFINYFIYGFSAFHVNLEGQVAATDVNADGQTLSVGDLVYLIRVIVGDADPIPKPTPYADELILSTTPEGDVITVTTDAVGSIGAALLVYDIAGHVIPGTPQPGAQAAGMQLKYSIENGELRVLLYDIGKHMVQPGKNHIIDIPFSGDGRLTLKSAEIVDYQGRPYRVSGGTSELPTGFTLRQNYPNPFNPSTVINFSLAVSSEWRLEIYNIAGRLVRAFNGFSESGTVSVEWDGRDNAGLPVASGVYLYRLEAADFSASKKMILVK